MFVQKYLRIEVYNYIRENSHMFHHLMEGEGFFFVLFFFFKFCVSFLAEVRNSNYTQQNFI